MDILIDYYQWIKAIHIMAVISWMAGLFYLPRLYVYHADVPVGSDQDILFQTMEYKLLRVIMNPAMIVAWVFGLLLILSIDAYSFGWFHVKFAGVLAMTWFHMKCAGWRKMFARGENDKPHSYFRKMNEVPTVLMIIIVIMVIVRPF